MLRKLSLISLPLALSLSTAQAVVYEISTSGEAANTFIGDAVGTPFGENANTAPFIPGVWQVGTMVFSNIADDTAIGGISDTAGVNALLSDFRQFGTGNGFFGDSPTTANFAGQIGSVGSAAVASGSELDGAAVYLIAGNGDTLDASSSLLVWKSSTETFPNDDDPTAALTLKLPNDPTFDTTSILLGSAGTVILDNQGTPVPLPGLLGARITVIPEPSSLALFGFALAGLGLRRRRR